MNYYKIIQNNQIICAISSKNFIQYFPDANCFLRCGESEGQYVSYKGKLYRDTWLCPTNSEIAFELVQIIPIEKAEYDIYRQAIENNEQLIIDDDDEEEEEIITPEEPDISVEFVRASKIKEMSANCRATIEAGFDLALRGETRHFSLTTQDQLNLMSASTMAQTQNVIPYHADGEECEFYTANEINIIVTQATALKNYNLAYYNSLKAYINTLDTIEEIAAIQYGTPIPEEYKSDVLKILEY